jgi:hypothetical protein
MLRIGSKWRYGSSREGNNVLGFVGKICEAGRERPERQSPEIPARKEDLLTPNGANPKHSGFFGSIRVNPSS